MFDVRTVVDCLNCSFFRFSYCGPFAARSVPSGTIIYFLRGRSTNREKGFAEVLEERAIRFLGRALR